MAPGADGAGADLQSQLAEMMTGRGNPFGCNVNLTYEDKPMPNSATRRDVQFDPNLAEKDALFPQYQRMRTRRRRYLGDMWER